MTAAVAAGVLGAAAAQAAQTFVSGQVITADGMVVASGAVALEKGELHNNAFLAGGAIGEDGTFRVPLPAGGPWGLHVYSEGYIYFPLQIQVKAGVDNRVPVILPVDGSTADDPRITDIGFKKISDAVFRVTMKVDDPDGNLGPQMLAIDTRRFKCYRLVPESGDLADKKADFPSGTYVSPFIPAALESEDPADWLFVVADHQCSNGPVLNGRGESVFRKPSARAEVLDCEVPGIWKSNFDKIYRFEAAGPGTFTGVQFEGRLIIDRMALEGDGLAMAFRFEGREGGARLKLRCEGGQVLLEGDYRYPDRSGAWVFTKLKNTERAPAGRRLFEANCAACHFADATESKVGPGLKGLFKADRLPSTGLPVTEENVRRRILEGGQKMPPFKHLAPVEVDALVDYLKGL